MLPIQNDVIVFGILMLLLGLIFKTASSELPFWKNFYKYVPSVLLCYLLPSFLRLFGVVDEEMVGKLYGMAKNYLLPASLVLMTLSIDFKGLARLGGHSLAMFFTATIGIVIGGPIAVLIVGFFSPETFQVAQESDEIWRGLSTLAGSWIGGGANQAAMLEVYEYNEKLYSGMVAVDIIVANLLMAFLLLGAGRTEAIDKWLGADSSKIEELKKSIETYRAKIAKIPTLSNLMVVLAVGFGAVGFSHLVSGFMLDLVFDSPALKASILGSGFFWVVVTATTIGLILSFTKARELEGVGASRIGSVCIYILVATIGMKMDIAEMFGQPWVIAIGLIWITIHITLLMVVAKLIKAPFFFVAVGSQANVGGAASAPVVASAFSPALAPVGVLLAVLGYALGTYGAIACAELMRWVSSLI
ncbi:MAG: putative membrane protein [Arenicella sp.]|jgi:uncharacterized membrane protein